MHNQQESAVFSQNANAQTFLVVILDENEITKALSYVSFSNLASVGCKPLGNDVNISGSDQPQIVYSEGFVEWGMGGQLMLNIQL